MTLSEEKQTRIVAKQTKWVTIPPGTIHWTCVLDCMTNRMSSDHENLSLSASGLQTQYDKLPHNPATITSLCDRPNLQTVCQSKALLPSVTFLLETIITTFPLSLSSFQMLCAFSQINGLFVKLIVSHTHAHTHTYIHTCRTKNVSVHRL